MTYRCADVVTRGSHMEAEAVAVPVGTATMTPIDGYAELRRREPKPSPCIGRGSPDYQDQTTTHYHAPPVTPLSSEESHSYSRRLLAPNIISNV